MRNRKLAWIFKIIKRNWLLLLILFSALFLRLYNLEILPYNFHEDEVLSGYIGRFILENGKDIYGNSWPLFYFDKFGDYYIIGPIYLSGLSTFIFGINQFAVRFPAALLGALLVIPIYLLTKELFQRKDLALLSSFFYAISPWSIVLSRTTTEGVIGTFFFTFALYLLINSIKNSSIKKLLLSNFLLLIGYFIYHPFRIYPPAIFFITLALIYLFKLKLTKKYKSLFIFSFVTFSLLTFLIGQTKWGKGRFLQTSIFSPVSGVQLKIQDLIFTEKTKNFTLIKFFHNKPWHYGREFLKQYFTYFSPNFLTINGWEKTRYSISEQGLIYLTFLFLFYFGVIQVLNKKPSFKKLFLVSLILLAPLPAAFTYVESPNPHRSFFLLIPISITIPLGIELLKKSTLLNKYLQAYLKKIFWITLIFFLTYEFMYFIHQYTVHFDFSSSLSRNDGQKEAAFMLQKLKKQYDKIYISSAGAMSWYYLFYSKNFDKNLIGKFGLDAKIKNIENIYFTENECPSQLENLPEKQPGDKIILIDRPTCESNFKEYKLVKTFHGKNLVLKYKILIPQMNK